VIDAATGTAVATLAVGRAPYGVAFDDAGGRAFVTNQQDASVSVIDLDAQPPTVIATWPTAEYPEGIAFDAGRLWVVSWMEDEVTIHGADSGLAVARVPVGRNPRAFGAFLAAARPAAAAAR
jgi:YVTN family beta-propeller protein